MEPQLTGLGLFTRPTPPRPTAVAVHLGLTPDPARPWAVRVSAPLAHPAPDGLARHVPEIERLAVVGKAIVDQCRGTFAAAVTTAGVRTWLVYAAASSAPQVDVPDYAVLVAVTSDAGWTGYRDLCPTPAEAEQLVRRRAESAAVAAARAATRDTVRSLRAAGVDLSRPGPVRYAVTVPPESSATFAARAVAAGLRPSDGAFVRDDLPDLPLILRTERWLIHEAARVGGTYGGWGPASAHPTDPVRHTWSGEAGA